MVADVAALGVDVIHPHPVHEDDLRAAGVDRATSAVILGDDDVRAVHLALMLEELAPGLRLVIEMSNPQLVAKLSQLIGVCTLLSSAELAAPLFVATAMASADTQTFEIGGRFVAAGPRGCVGGTELAVIGDSRLAGMDAVLPRSEGDVILGTKLTGRLESAARRSGLLSTLYLHFGGNGWHTSLYLALTASTAPATATCPSPSGSALCSSSCSG